MASASTLAEPASAGDTTDTTPSTGGPGSLTIKNRVGEQIARRAALTVDGVVAHHGALGFIGAGDYPKVDVDLSDPLPVVGVQIAVTWPSPITRVAQGVRTAVAAELHRLTGMVAQRVDVTVSAVITEDDRPTERRVL